MNTSLRRWTAFAVAAVILFAQVGATPIARPERLSPVLALASSPSLQRTIRDGKPPSHPRVRPTIPPLLEGPKHPVVFVRHPAPPPGVHLPGPAVAFPWLNDRTAHRNTRALAERFRSRQSAPSLTPASSPPRMRGIGQPVAGTAVRRAAAVDVTQPNVTGINRWWSYEEGAIPGAGRYMVNMWHQNLILQSDDMDVPYRGLDLAFRRTYNSYSGHDYAATDGSVVPGQFGNGWTNTFDAHMTQNSAGGMSIFDVDGARYDYSYDAGGNLVAPLGLEGTTLVTYDGGSFYWTKKSGAQYTFYAPYYAGNMAAYSGRIYRISGRNRNNYIQFTYAWDTDASSSAHLSQMYATTDSGVRAMVQFGDFNGRRLCSYIAYPDNQTYVWYGYDTAGNLNVVTRQPNAPGGPYRFVNYGGYHSNMYVSSPRWNASAGGGYVQFDFSTQHPNQVAGISLVGVMNFAPPDGTSSNLQSGLPTGTMGYSYTVVDGDYAGYTPVWDSHGHSYQQYFDPQGRPTNRYVYTGSQWLGTGEAWDVHNNRTAEIDARGFETDYAYDANGNTVAVAEPSTTVATPSGPSTFRPTQLFDYDQYNNVIAYCDQRASHPQGDWTTSGPPTAGGPDALCASNGSAAHAVFTYPTNPAPAYEPFGRLTNIRSPLGYNRAISYNPWQQGGADYGLPTAVRGDPIAQSDGTRTPLESLTYDTAGNLICSMADDSDATTTTVVAYDALNRVIAVGDPDDASLTNGACNKVPGIAGSAIVARTTYFPDDSAATFQSPSEAAKGVATQYTYDLDGNETSQTRHYADIAGTTTEWYDGAGRLVEVQQPRDPSDYYSFPWMTRYVYDLTQGGVLSLNNITYRAYGNLAKKQEYLGAPAGTGWTDTHGSSADGADRITESIGYAPGNTSPQVTSFFFDESPATLGKMSRRVLPTGEQASFAYDAAGFLTGLQFMNDGGRTPSEAIVYDPAGRPARVTSSLFGTEQQTYDADGRLISYAEPNGGGLTSAATITYGYYADGLRKALSVASSGLTQDGLQNYTYRPDGAIKSLTLAYSGASYVFATNYTGGGRLSSGRDPYFSPVAQYAYDKFGRLSSHRIPHGTYQGFTYDAEGEITGFTGYSSALLATGVQQSNHYTARGDLVGQTYTPNATTADDWSQLEWQTKSANGYQYPVLPSDTGVTPFVQFDPLTSVALQVSPSRSMVDSFYGYDASGRQTAATDDWDYPNPCKPDGSSACDVSGNGSYSKQYDAEDHLVSASYVNWNAGTGALGCRIQRVNSAHAPKLTIYDGTSQYAWGPNGHPDRLTLPDGRVETLHWDGDTLLFSSNASGVVDDIKVGGQADLLPGDATGLKVFDRDYGGLVAAAHNATGLSPWSPPNPNRQNCSPPNAYSSNYRDTVAVVQEPGLDGISDGRNVIQGVRAYDPGLGSWTAPDAYAGDVRDPMSQKPYMWNRNSPYAYADPSGYCTIPGPDGKLKPIGCVDAKPVPPGKQLMPNGQSVASSVADTQHLRETLGEMMAMVPLGPEGAAASSGGRWLLTRNMLRAGLTRSGRQVAHHIVAFAAPRAARARAVLARFGIDINDEVNGVFIDKIGSHSNAYFDTINDIMSQATSADEARGLLQQIANDIRSGDIKP